MSKCKKRHVNLARLFLFLVACLCCAEAQDAQTSAPQSSVDPITTIRLQSRLTIVDVVVTDRKGPIKGLKKNEFTLTENGQPMQIKSFEEHTGALPGTLAPQLHLEPGVHTNLPMAPQTDTLTVLLIDGLNTSFTDQPFVKSEMLKYLKGMPPGNRVAIFTLGLRLRFIQGFSDDPTLLAAALKKKGPNNLLPQSEGGGASQVPDDPSSNAEMNLGTDGAVANIQGFESDLKQLYGIQRNEITIEAFQEIADYLSNFPGRKNLIWFADSFPLVIGTEYSPDLDPNIIGTGPDKAREMTNMLTKAEISVFPVDAGGLKPPTGYSASQSGPPNPGSLSNDFNRDAAKHTQMNELAEDTGGKAMYNTNDLKGAVAKIVDSSTFYYTIAFVPPPSAADGKFRKLKVTVPGRNYTLSYRKGYFSKSPDLPAGTEYAVDPNVDPDKANPFYRTMRRGAPTSSQIVFVAKVLPRDPQPDLSDPGRRLGKEAAELTGPLVRYNIDWNVDLRSISTTVGEDGERSGTLRFAAVAFDADGKALNSNTPQEALKFTPAQFTAFVKRGFPASMQLDLPKGEVFLRLGVFDPNGNKVGSMEIPLIVKPGGTSVVKGKEDINP